MTDPTLAAADIGRLEALHRDLLDLCLRLEAAASEPGVAGELRALADAVPPLLSAVHELEERLLFPDFDRHAGSCFAAMAIERLKAEHRCDRLAAEELSLTLTAVADERCGLSPQTVSRMIGGFQESLRRHVFSEQMILEALLSAKAEARDVFA
jgi:iron-sulfur cluster repair protein YtfE (RIC family)